MELCNSLNSIFKISISFLLLLLLSNNTAVNSENFSSNFTVDPICKNAICGHGTCVTSSSTILGFDCQCNDGWKKFPDGPSFPCLIPNCTFGLQCDSPTPSPSPPFSGISLPNFTNPCSLAWCNEGVCVVNGTGHLCQCHADNDNLLHNPAFPCFLLCRVRGDCKKDGLEPPSPSPTTSGQSNGKIPESPTSDSSSLNPGSNKGANSLGIRVEALIISILVSSIIFHTWII